MNKRHRLWPTVTAVLALVLLFVTERVLSGFDSVRTPSVVFGGGALLVTAAARAQQMGYQAQNALAGPGRAFFGAHLLMLAGVALYLLLRVVDDSKMAAVLWVLWPFCVGSGLAIVATLELQIWPTASSGVYEVRRLRDAWRTGLAVSLLLTALVLANWLGARHELKVDLSESRTAKASASTRQIVRALSKEVEVTLFYPRANDVRQVLETYFDGLSHETSRLAISVRDQALDRERAKAAGIRDNGYVAVSVGDKSEKIRVGLKLERARAALKTFDANFAKAIVKTTRESGVAYFTVGHGERLTNPQKDDPRPALRKLKDGLRKNRYQVKDLGLTDGLASGVPDDAGVLFIMGPEKHFLPAEIESLKRALTDGVRMFIALEADRRRESGEPEGEPLDGLLEALGLRFDPTLLADEKVYMRLERTEADRHHILSNKYSAHASVTAMTRPSQKLGVLFSRSGSLSAHGKPLAGIRTDMAISGLPSTFKDANRNRRYDSSENKTDIGLAAAATHKVDEDSETRVFVSADVDMFTDKYLTSAEGHGRLIGGVLFWLLDLKEPVLPTVSEADVRIVHRRDEDSLWFYGTIALIPIFVLLLGLIRAVGRRRT